MPFKDVFESDSPAPKDMATKQFKDAFEPPLTTAAQEPGFLSRVGSQLKQRVSNMPELMQSGTPMEKIGRGVGQGFAAMGDVLGESVRGFMEAGQSKGYHNLEKPESPISPETSQRISDFLTEPFKKLVQTPLGREGIQAIKKGGEIWSEFRKNYPDIAMDIEAFANVFVNAPVGFGVKATGKAVGAVGKEAVSVAKDVSAVAKGVEGIDKAIQGTVQTGFEKGVKPSLPSVGKSASLRDNYFKNASAVTQDIVENKNVLELLNKDGNAVKGMLPQSADNLLDAVSQRKQNIFKEYDAMKKAAGESGATVDVAPLLKKYDEMLADRMVKDDKAMYKHLKAQKDIWSEFDGKITVEEAQKKIAELNAKLKPTYGKVGYSDVGIAHVDAIKASYLRKALDEAITNEAGPGYQALKNKYGAYRSIEDDVARRVNTIAGQPPKGMFDLSDVWVGYHAMYSTITGNLPSLASATFAHFIKNRMKALRDPDRNIKNMFENVENLMNRKARIGDPQSKTGQLMQRKMGEFDRKRASLETTKEYLASGTKNLEEGITGLKPSKVAEERAMLTDYWDRQIQKKRKL